MPTRVTDPAALFPERDPSAGMSAPRLSVRSRAPNRTLAVRRLTR
jgi:hypothetical protein